MSGTVPAGKGRAGPDSGLLSWASALDRGVVRRVSESDSRVLDVVMPRLSVAANHGLLWIGLATVIWATGDRWARRAAWRGLGALAVASLAANVAGKRLAGRARPTGKIPAGRRLGHPLRTSSFPSGHAASAAAFAVGAAVEKPCLAAPVGALALAVAGSRVVTGVHYPSDVLGGLAVGAGAVAATLRWWPRRPPVPAAVIRPPQQAPTAPSGQGLALAVNRSAGSVSTSTARWLRRELPHAVIVETDASRDLACDLRRAAARARILGVAGGDGTIAAAAGVAVELEMPLLVIPAGTFNHFAADLGVRSAADALAALRAGEAVLVDVGVAGGRPFVNTSSTGLYTDLVLARQRLEPRFGRQAAVVIALIQVLRGGRPHELILDGGHRWLWLCFAGNCGYEPTGMAPGYRPDLADGNFDIRVVEDGFLARSRLVAAVLTGTLGRCRVYHAWRAGTLGIASAHGAPVWLSVDGEIAIAEPAVWVRKHPGRLLVYRGAGG
ncbi:MAG TPA: phosphatase PAP2 family protein [Streptosporangiaceae bacterium]